MQYRIVFILIIEFGHLFAIQLTTKYKQLCQENKKLENCALQTFTVKSQLSCFKECEIIQQCESVNILYEDVKQYRCELNYCSEINCENVNMTLDPYKYFYKIGKIQDICHDLRGRKN